MFFKHRCYNGGNQHNYEAVYEHRFRYGPPDIQGPVKAVPAIINSLKEDVYIKHVCKWCGKSIKIS